MKIEAISVEEVIEKSGDKKESILILDTLIKSIVPDIKRWLLTSQTYTIIGYGKLKHHDDYPLIGIAPQKKYISLYVIGKKDGRLLTDIYRNKLGKVKVGKSCISIRNIDTVDKDELKNLLLDSIAWNQKDNSK